MGGDVRDRRTADPLSRVQKRLALVVNTEIWRLVPKSSPDAGEAGLRHYLHYRLNGASEKFYCLNKVLIFNIILLC